MDIIDFVLICGPQSLEEGKEINTIEIKIENNKLQNIFEKLKKNSVRFILEGLLSLSSIKSNTEKIFLQTVGLSDAKFGLINDKYKQTFGVINLNKIENWSKIKKTSRWASVNFQKQSDNKNTSHFS